MYVDNLLIECETEKEAIDKSSIAKQILKDADMNLREFLSHSPNVMKQIPEDDRLDKTPAKVLGLTWDTPSDCITFSLPKDTDATATRRSVLSIIASTSTRSDSSDHVFCPPNGFSNGYGEKEPPGTPPPRCRGGNLKPNPFPVAKPNNCHPPALHSRQAQSPSTPRLLRRVGTHICRRRLYPKRDCR
ncbi:hypothetical protein niasHS_015526 [Heterodera schachtii]|uniref:Uncharacterized protein n=1 Tax=Heterodera schachtii TaxID=97005 RepID=A0ABD2HXL3_HETSC